MQALSLCYCVIQIRYYDKYVKTKINVNTYFYNNEMTSENECYAYLSVILLDSPIDVDKNVIHKCF